jgi:hypothetical protein
MKIILEFSHEEAQMAEQAYRGPEYAAALEEFRAHFRNLVAHGEYSEDTARELQTLYQDFKNIFQGLFLE